MPNLDLTEAVDAAFAAMVATNSPRTADDSPYPACLRPIAEAVVAAAAPLIAEQALDLLRHELHLMAEGEATS